MDVFEMRHIGFRTDPFSVSKLDQEPQKTPAHPSAQQEQLDFSFYFAGARQEQPSSSASRHWPTTLVLKTNILFQLAVHQEENTMGVYKTEKLLALLEMFNYR